MSKSLLRLKNFHVVKLRKTNEPTILRRAAQSDSTAQHELFERHVGYVQRLLCRLLGHGADIADATQDVFLEIFGNCSQLRDPAAFKGWLRAIIVATARNRMQRARRRQWLSLLPRAQRPELVDKTSDDDDAAALCATYRVIERMAPDLRIVFTLRFIEQLGLVEVASACGVSLATVKRRVEKSEERFRLAARREPYLAAWLTREGQ